MDVTCRMGRYTVSIIRTRGKCLCVEDTAVGNAPQPQKARFPVCSMLIERVWQYRARRKAYRRPHEMRFPAAQVLHRYCTAQVRAGHTRSVGLVKLGRLGQIGGSVGVRMLEGDVWGIRRVNQDVKVEVMGGLL